MDLAFINIQRLKDYDIQTTNNMVFHWSLTYSGLSIYNLFVWSNSRFLHNSQWITFPTQSYLVLYSFGASLLYSLIMRLVVLFLSPHRLRLLICCVLSKFALTLLVPMALFYTVIGRNSGSPWNFTFLSDVRVFRVRFRLLVVWSIHRVSFFSYFIRILLYIRGSLNKFPDFFVWELLLIVHT